MLSTSNTRAHCKWSIVVIGVVRVGWGRRGGGKRGGG